MAFVGAISVAATSVTIPGPRMIDDTELMFVFRSGSTTAPTIPSPWLLIASGTTTTTWAGLYYRICADVNDTSGTFTNASGLACAVYRGVLGIGAKSTFTFGTATTVTFAAIASPIQSAGRSVFVGCAGHKTATAASMAVAPTGMVNRTGAVTAFANINDTNGGAASWASQTITASASSGNGGIVVELLMDNSTWSPYDEGGSITLSNANRTATSSSAPANHNGIRSFIGRKAGKYGFAAQCTAFGQTFSVDYGICTLAASLLATPGWSDSLGVTVDFSSSAVTAIWGNNTSGSQLAVGTIAVNDTLYFVFDLTAGLAWMFSTTNGNWNNSGTANPDTGVGGFAYTDVKGSFLYPFMTSGNNGSVTIINTHDISGAGLKSFLPWDALPVAPRSLIVSQAVNRAGIY